MKKPIYLILLLTLVHFGLVAQDGAYTAYRMVIKSTGQCVTNENNTLKMADKKTGHNAWSQYFIVTRIDEQHVMLAAAVDNHLFLKRLNGEVVLESYSDGDAIAPFSWQLHFAGGKYHYLTMEEEQTNVALTAVAEDIQMEQPPFISGCDSDVADMFRVSLEPVTNTF